MNISRRTSSWVAGATLLVILATYVIVGFDPNNFGDALLGLTATSAWSFVLILRRSAWRKIIIGRSLMYLAIGISLILSLNVAFVILDGPYPGRDQLRIVLYLTLLMTFINMNLVTLVLQKKSVNLKKSDTIDGSAS